MARRRHLGLAALAALALLTTGCRHPPWDVGTARRAGSGWSAYPVEPAAVPPLAVAVARGNAGTGVTRARLVATTLARAEAFESGFELHLSAAEAEQPAILVSLDGDFVGNEAKRPAGAPAPTGANLYAIVAADTGRIVSWGLRPEPPAALLSTLGTVVEVDPDLLR